MENDVAYGLMFHHFHGYGHPVGQGSLSEKDLGRIIEYLGDHLLDADEWFKRATTGSLQEGETCLTFDDTLQSQYDVALPVLENRGIRAFWFIYTGPLEGIPGKFEIYRHFRTTRFSGIDEFYREFYRNALTSGHAKKIREILDAGPPPQYLPKDQYPFYTEQDRRFRYIRDAILDTPGFDAIMTRLMKDQRYNPDDVIPPLWMDQASVKSLSEQGHIIGLHSHTHPHTLARLAVREQEEEYRKNHAAITRITGELPVCMAHPNNSYSQETLRVLVSLGIRVGFRSNRGPVLSRSMLEWPREDHANLNERIGGS
jgi:peptidoglycan/xylan/chitin deacetylase (PgdA/CDA1 family)